MGTVCETCGDIGFEEALVYCDSCKIEAIHRYCVGIKPVPFTEYITWICDDCDESDSDSNSNEVDQTTKLGNVMKKSDKRKKRSSNVEAMEVSSSLIQKQQCQTAKPVLAEDHGIEDATNVEAMEVSSSPIQETMKVNRRESSDRGKSHELIGLVRNGASSLEAGDSSSVLDHNTCTSKRSQSS